MPLTLANCARCGRLYAKVYSPVCQACQPEEDADYERIRTVLGRVPGMSVTRLAEEAGVTLAVVTRMLETGLIANNEIQGGPTCGRCGAPAISFSKRLCEPCLATLDRECAKAMRETREKMVALYKGTRHEVHKTVEEKRARAEQRRQPVEPERPTAPPRMAVRDRVARGARRR